MNFSKCHAEGKGKEWRWEESTSGLSPRGCSSKGAWKDQGKCLLGNIVSIGISAQVSKHTPLALFFLLTLQGAAVCSQEKVREERKALLFRDRKIGGANVCSHTCQNPLGGSLHGLYHPGLKSLGQKMKLIVTWAFHQRTLLEKFLFLRYLFHFNSHTGKDSGKSTLCPSKTKKK